MKQLQIAVETNHGGMQRKTLTFPVPDETAKHIEKLHEEMAERLAEGIVCNDPTQGFAIEGSKRIRISLSLMDMSINF